MPDSKASQFVELTDLLPEDNFIIIREESEGEFANYRAAKEAVSPDASSTKKGLIKLAGDLAGTADLPTVPELDLKANKNSPEFTGIPTAPTPSNDNNSNQIATTAYVQNNLDGYAPINNPIFTGIVTVPNQGANSNNNRAANTAYVDNGLDLKADTTYVDSELALKSNITYVDAALALKANLASPALTGNPTAPTPAWGDSDNSLATTSFISQAFTPKLIVSKPTSQNIPNNTSTRIISYSAPQLDTDSAFNISTGIFTVPTGRSGTYLITGLIGVGVAGNSPGYGQCLLFVNVSGFGDVPLDQKQLTNSLVTGMFVTGTATLNLGAGQQISLWVNIFHDLPPTNHNISQARFTLQRIP